MMYMWHIFFLRAEQQRQGNRRADTRARRSKFFSPYALSTFPHSAVDGRRTGMQMPALDSSRPEDSEPPSTLEKNRPTRRHRRLC